MTRNLFSMGFYITNEFEPHNEIKQILLQQMEEQSNHDLVNSDDYYSDNIHRLDWKQSTNVNRPWVQTFLPYLESHIHLLLEQFMYKEWNIAELWFQQYTTGNTHGWHSHGSNFTAVYYLELPDDSPKTQLVQPFTNKIFDADVKEGDIIVFPSYVVHRAPVVESNTRKTIISFNFDMRNPNEILLHQLRG